MSSALSTFLGSGSLLELNDRAFSTDTSDGTAGSFLPELYAGAFWLLRKGRNSRRVKMVRGFALMVPTVQVDHLGVFLWKVGLPLEVLV